MILPACRLCLVIRFQKVDEENRDHTDSKKMRGTSDKLDEKYILPIARELAIGLKAIHDAGIIHRDIKAANVMIHEKGMVQIIDFGVAGVLRTSIDKRSTVIGTPHWMAPELHKNAPPEGLNYGTEVSLIYHNEGKSAGALTERIIRLMYGLMAAHCTK